MSFAVLKLARSKVAAGSLAIGALTLVATAQPGLLHASAQDATTFTTGESIAVSTDALNMRDDASASGSVLAILPQAAFGTIVSGPTSADDYDWYLIDVDGLEGYVAGDYLVDSASSTFTAGDAIIVNTDALNMRSDASASADVVSTLAEGTSASVVDGPVDADGYSWYQIDVDGTTGWVVRDFIAYGEDAVGADSTADVGTATAFSGTTLLVNTDSLNVRDAASTSGAVLETLAMGDSVSATGAYTTADGYSWAEVVTTSGTDGYVVSDYLTDDSSALLLVEGATASVNTDSLTLRGTAGLSGEELGTLESGASVTILSASEAVDGYLWYEVESDAGTGWVAGAYLAV